MGLIEEVNSARKTIVTDGYDMSVGEVVNLYKNKELIISPNFQRLFRWDDERKTRFIESLLLGIPIPPIFVFQDDDGVWELIDGLQRVSTILELTGDLIDSNGRTAEPLRLNGTKYLPSLRDMMWKRSAPKRRDGLDKSLQIAIRRSRIRVEILKSESDATAKYELFQRLNTGGVRLAPQEVRNSIAISIDEEFYNWLVNLSQDPNFINTTNQTKTAIDSESGTELALRFLAFRSIKYKKGLDVHEYLDDALINLASNKKFNRKNEESVFRLTFKCLNDTLGSNSFKRWDGHKFSGKFLMSVFEVVATGTSKNIAEINKMSDAHRKKFLNDTVSSLWSNLIFRKYSGAGVRGTERLSNLLPIADKTMKP